MTLNRGIYIHVPFCKHACPYCDFYKLELRDRPARARLDFPARIAREAELRRASDPDWFAAPIETIYFGGGTPSTLVPEAVGELVAGLLTMFPRGENPPEITLEANPENLTEGRARKWKDAGITRLSIGVQSFHDADLKLLERLHEPATIDVAVAHARAAGFGNISLDLMFALPGQTLPGWLANLRRALELGPDHLSFYGLTYHEGTPFEVARRSGRLTPLDEELQAAIYLEGAALLEAAGFEHYEISNFARPGFRSRHNQRYWRRTDVIALGPGAHGNVGARRWANVEDLDAWAAAVDGGRFAESESGDVATDIAAQERLFTALRRSDGIMRVEDDELYRACVGWLSAKGDPRWMVIDGERARLTREGWLVSDTIIAGIAEH